MKIFRKGFVVLLLTVTALLIATLAFAGDPLFAGALRAYGPPAIGQPLDFDDASLSILGGSAEIQQLAVGQEQEPLIEIGRFAFDADAFALLAGRLAIDEAALNATHLRLIIDENGRLGFDPGPPPAGTEPSPEAKKPEPETEPKTPPTPPEDRDLVQIVEELWERYEEYKEYYDEYGGIFIGGEEEQEEVRTARSRWPGKPAYLDEQARAAESAKAGAFWLGKAEVANFSWETLDKRTGQQILPAIASGTLRVENLGSPPLDENGVAQTPTSLIHAAADFADDGGRMLLSLGLPRDGSATTLDLQLSALPIDSLQRAVNRSLPYDLSGGVFDLVTSGLSFSQQSLQGEIVLQLRNVQLKPRAQSPEVLGVKPAEFCSVLNRALTSQPVEFRFSLGGTPTDPKFRLEDATDLDDLIVDALTDEAKARAQAELDEQRNKLEAKANEELSELEQKAEEAIGDKAKDLLGDKAKKGLGGLLGGNKKGGG